MKHSISLIAPAKLNLNLYVKDKLENGYHSLESDVCFLDLYDEITIEPSNLDEVKISDKSTFFLKDESILKLGEDYPSPIVVHEKARHKALEAFKKI